LATPQTPPGGTRMPTVDVVSRPACPCP